VLARALLAERSGEEIAAALARLYRSRLPAPEDVLDPGQDRGRSRDDRFERGSRNERGDDGASESRAKKTGFRHSMAGGSVWFRVGVGRQKNAEARWLLPMLCRRGGIVKQDIGAIRIYGTHSEFEISGQAAEKFSANLKRPDKEENIRIEPLAGGPQGETSPEKPLERQENRSEIRQESAKPAHDTRTHDNPGFKKKPDYAKKRPFHQKHHRDNKPAHAGQPRPEGAGRFAKPAFGKKPKKNKFHG
jgi:ATP-dependent RNA helicase DeaD